MKERLIFRMMMSLIMRSARKPIGRARIVPDGDSAVTVEFGTSIDPEIHDRVLAFAEAIQRRSVAGVMEVVPTYASVTVYYDPLLVSRHALTERIRRLLKGLTPRSRPPSRVVEIPVCYDAALGPDLDGVSQAAGLSRDTIIHLHTSPTYRVYLLGFLPGFPYMAHVPPPLVMPRLATPRTLVPAGSVAIAGHQTGIYPIESPGGWRVIGRTPIRMYAPERHDPFFLTAGDEVRFFAIDRRDYDRHTGTS